MPITPLHTPDAPEAIGPYSQAMRYDNFVQTSGQIALDPATMQMVGGGDTAAETTQVMKNLLAILRAAGSGPDKIIKTTIFLADMADFAVVNKIYEEALAGHKPARSTIQAAGLPKGAKVEIEALAVVE